MFVQVFQGPVADTGEAREALDRWARELAPGSYGWLGTTAGVTEGGTLVAVARFESREEARRNSDRPEQTQWWMETAKLFAGEVTFHDCDQVDVYLRGGSDSAGFVQVIEGRVGDPARVRELLRRCEPDLAGFRPDLIGGLAAVSPDGDYVETAYFTSEGEARMGERAEPPARLREEFEELMSLFELSPVYHDLRDPWLYSPGPR
ncbi:hypothetical protein [Nonomuraea rhodomycinica]|uniref:Antibiotic biosynthesis monooxygenase n=1 Tax=Nonomuraea rhodomycinica TaxID=1712872 RepID=A0A7Y6IIU4_9ACTN|nr:hypothetical protein [Nonomuraea rhodomycinica]NUW39067.1 hypothetical protein [Nonomuraea rhodomycinica]